MTPCRDLWVEVRRRAPIGQGAHGGFLPTSALAGDAANERLPHCYSRVAPSASTGWESRRKPLLRHHLSPLSATRPLFVPFEGIPVRLHLLAHLFRMS